MYFAYSIECVKYARVNDKFIRAFFYFRHPVSDGSKNSKLGHGATK